MSLVAILRERLRPDARADEADAIVQEHAVAEALTRLGHQHVTVEVAHEPDASGHLPALHRVLDRINPDLCFNLVEALDGKGSLVDLVPRELERVGRRFTGNSATAHATTARKTAAKAIIAAANDPILVTPDWRTFDHLRSGHAPVAPGPWIIKSDTEHASLGLDDASVITIDHAPHAAAILCDEIHRRLPALGGDALAERYIEGREFNIALLGGLTGPGSVHVLPVAEMCFEGYAAGRPRLVGYAAKWHEASFEYNSTIRRFDFAPSDAPLIDQLRAVALGCWHLFRLRGWARVDLRVDAMSTPWILEINTNPCLSPDAGFAATLAHANITFDRAIKAILTDTEPNP